MDRELKQLKKDVFGSVFLIRRHDDGALVTRRDTGAASTWARWLARRLAAREARALRCLPDGINAPRLLSWDGTTLERSWLPGEPLHIARCTDPKYYKEALRLVRLLHRYGVAHNDLAKEPNWLVTPDGSPAVIDFQLASISQRRGLIFRILAREDLRHLFKLKRGYCPAFLSSRQRSILARPSPVSRLWMVSGKRLYLWITRSLLGWADREGAGDRAANSGKL